MSKRASNAKKDAAAAYALTAIFACSLSGASAHHSHILPGDAG
jgi:hypothetical protein